MKLNKLLTPILGLATVSTVVAPIATSCSSETSADHVKISNKSEEVTPNSSGLANYLFVLDSHDYDVHGFKVSTTVDKKDTSGVVDSDFTTTWEIDGDHLLVHVQYEGEEAPEDDVPVKLNIHIYYGTEWNKTFDVKFNYQANKPIDMTYIENDQWGWTSSDKIKEFTTGENVSFIADLSKMSDTAFASIDWLIDGGFYLQSTSETTTGVGEYYYICFENIAIYVDGKEIEESGNYTPFTPELKKVSINASVGVIFKENFIKFLTKTSKITFKCNKIHVIKYIKSTSTISEEKSNNGFSVLMPSGR